jgi:hypothetical protein
MIPSLWKPAGHLTTIPPTRTSNAQDENTGMWTHWLSLFLKHLYVSDFQYMGMEQTFLFYWFRKQLQIQKSSSTKGLRLYSPALASIQDIQTSWSCFGQWYQNNPWLGELTWNVWTVSRKLIAKRNLLSKVCIQLCFPVLFALKSELIVYVVIYH